MRLICLMFLSVIIFQHGKGQTTDGLVAYYSFDACDATDDTGNGANGIIMGNANCGCGVIGNGLEFDGNTSVQILGNPDVIFGDDFTISFYFLPDPQSNSVMNILSKSETCGIDSTVELRYHPITREISLALSEHADLSIRNGYSVPTTKCYHHIAFVRRDRELFIYYDGVQISKSPSSAFVSIENNGILTLGGSPCQANGQVPFNGVLDELRLYNRALTSLEIVELNSPIDEITSPDTVLFTGTSFMVRLPVTCASSIQWSPSTGVSDVNIAEPILGPMTTTSYNVEMDYGFCLATDQIHIQVADSSDLDCDKVFFPSAFSPNGDNLNDVWGISNVVFFGEFIALQVWDRWGGEVFNSTDANMPWDGTLKGEKLMPGIYVYQLAYTCNGEERRKRGSVTMLR